VASPVHRGYTTRIRKAAGTGIWLVKPGLSRRSQCRAIGIYIAQARVNVMTAQTRLEVGLPLGGNAANPGSVVFHRGQIHRHALVSCASRWKRYCTRVRTRAHNWCVNRQVTTSLRNLQREMNCCFARTAH
jgi:hypothetical protein